MFNDTKKSWILGREIADWRFGKAKEQIRILTKESRSEGYTVVGSTEICEPITTMDSLQKIEPMMDVVRRRQIDAVFVMSIRHICENLDIPSTIEYNGLPLSARDRQEGARSPSGCCIP